MGGGHGERGGHGVSYIIKHEPKVTRLTVRPDRLAHDTTFNMVAPSRDVADRRVLVDLSNVRFVEPFGLVHLFLSVRHIASSGARQVIIDIPRGSVFTYLTRMHFIDQVEKLDGVEVRNRIWVRARDLRSRLLELQVCDIQNEDDAEELSERLYELLYRNRGPLGLPGELVRLSLFELIGNVAVHSGTSTVYIAAQSYADDEISLAVGDAGIGIPGRLRRSRVIPATYRDPEALRKALEPAVSTRVGRGGMGLTMLHEYVRDGAAARMSIRSGTAHITSNADGDRLHGTCTPLPGTIVEYVFK